MHPANLQKNFTLPPPKPKILHVCPPSPKEILDTALLTPHRSGNIYTISYIAIKSAECTLMPSTIFRFSRYSSYSPRSVIQRKGYGASAGECWAFYGGRGFLTIGLSKVNLAKCSKFANVFSALMSPLFLTNICRWNFRPVTYNSSIFLYFSLRWTHPNSAARFSCLGKIPAHWLFFIDLFIFRVTKMLITWKLVFCWAILHSMPREASLCKCSPFRWKFQFFNILVKFW